MLRLSFVCPDGVEAYKLGALQDGSGPRRRTNLDGMGKEIWRSTGQGESRNYFYYLNGMLDQEEILVFLPMEFLQRAQTAKTDSCMMATR